MSDFGINNGLMTRVPPQNGPGAGRGGGNIGNNNANQAGQGLAGGGGKGPVQHFNWPGVVGFSTLPGANPTHRMQLGGNGSGGTQFNLDSGSGKLDVYTKFGNFDILPGKKP